MPWMTSGARSCSWTWSVSAPTGAIGRDAFYAVAGERIDNAGFQIERADAFILEVDDIERVVRRVEGDAVDFVEFGLRGGAAVAAEAFLARARDGA